MFNINLSSGNAVYKICLLPFLKNIRILSLNSAMNRRPNSAPQMTLTDPSVPWPVAVQPNRLTFTCPVPHYSLLNPLRHYGSQKSWYAKDSEISSVALRGSDSEPAGRI